MARYRKRRRLDRTTRNQLLVDLAQAMTVIRSPEEGAKLIQDLLTEPEAEMLAKRLAIADRLIQGARYEDIQRELSVSPPTIARITAWLNASGEGFLLVRSRKKRGPTMTPQRKRRARVTMYNWPTHLLEEIIRQANEKQRQRLEAEFQKLGKKSALYEELSSILKKYH